MLIFDLRPVCLALCVALALVSGRAGAEENNRFDGTWEGKIEAGGHCNKFEPTLLTAVIEGGGVSVTSKDGHTITLRGQVDAYDEIKLTGKKAGSGGWYSGKGPLHVSGRFRGNGFK